MTRIVLRHVRILDGTGGPPIEDGLLVVDNGVIELVAAPPSPLEGEGGRGGEGASPTPDLDLDAAGLTVLPGLTNSHTHFVHDHLDTARPRRPFPGGEMFELLRGVGRAQTALEQGITTLRDCNCGSYGTMAIREAFERGTLVGPRLVLSGKAICATGGHMYMVSREADGPHDVRAAVREQIKAGADFIKLVAEAASGGSEGAARPPLQLTAEEMAAGVDAAHKLGKRVTAHAVSKEGIAEALAARVDCIEHGYGLTDEQIQQMAERGTWLVPTLSVHASIIKYGPALGWEARRPASQRILDRGMDTVRRAYQAGVRIAAGSDGGSPANPIWELVLELELLEQAGVPAGQVLRMATSSAAELIGVSGSRGTVAPGQVADLLLVAGNPLERLGALREIRLVVKAGAVVVDRLSGSRARGF